VETRKSRITSPNFATLSESPIIKTLFIIGTGGAERFFSLGAATTNTTSTRASTSASGLSNARASGDQSIRAERAGIFVFIFYLDFMLQIDQAGLVFAFDRVPRRTFQLVQSQSVCLADLVLAQRLFSQPDVGWMHHQHLALAVSTAENFSHVVHITDQRF